MKSDIELPQSLLDLQFDPKKRYRVVYMENDVRMEMIGPIKHVTEVLVVMDMSRLGLSLVPLHHSKIVYIYETNQKQCQPRPATIEERVY